MLPQGFSQRMKALLGDAEPLFRRALEEEAPCRALRMDPARIDEEALSRALAGGLGERVPFADDAYYFSFDGIGNLPLHHGGAVYVQEPAAMAPVAALPEGKVNRILDLCAAPGGKSLQAAKMYLAPDGVLVCNEPVAVRRKALMQNVERVGEKRALVTGFDATALPKEFYGAFDLVICDVPCSGEGMMRKEPEAISRWSEENIRSLAALQKRILASAAAAVGKGGLILYSTCTWSLEENEEQIRAFLEEREEFSLVSPREEVAACAAPGRLEGTLRFYPHLFRGEGQFLAILKKEGEKSPVSEKKRKQDKKKEPYRPVVEAFLKECLAETPDGEILFRGEEVYLQPKHPFPEELFYSPGVCLGTVQKGRVVPHHRLFAAFASLFRQKAVLADDDPRVEAYLHGEEIPLEGKGYGVLFCGNIPLGGVKISGGRGKNLYPKGLRK